MLSPTDLEAPHCAVFSIPLLPAPSQAQIFSSAPYSKTPSAYIPPSKKDQVSNPYKTTGKIKLLYI